MFTSFPGFFGCIRRIIVNNVDLELDQPSQGSEVMACADQVCNLNPDCRNGATCLDDPSSDLMYQCVCPAGFTGNRKYTSYHFKV